jgi:hypothetical protein
MEEYAFLFTLPWLCLIAQIGMFTHFLKQKVKGETLTEIGRYFRDNVKSTLIALIVTQITVMGLALSTPLDRPLDLVTVFLLGFTFDNTINKWEKPTA